MKERNKTLGEFIIEKQKDFQYSTGELSKNHKRNPTCRKSGEL